MRQIDDPNVYKKVANTCCWFGDKIMLSKVLKKSWHEGFWAAPGGKVEKREAVTNAVQREFLEETGHYLTQDKFRFVDCFIYTKRGIKVYLFETQILPAYFDYYIQNPEPEKQSDWELFTKKQALKLKLLPSIRFYLENNLYRPGIGTLS